MRDNHVLELDRYHARLHATPAQTKAHRTSHGNVAIEICYDRIWRSHCSIATLSKRLGFSYSPGVSMTDHVRDACEACYQANRDDCSGFVRAVGAKLGVTITGLANEIVGTLRTSKDWRGIPDGAAAAARAAAGKLVVAGLRGDEQFEHSNHGHVVVVVAGPLARKLYPTAYWGSLGGAPAKDQTINWAWTEHDRDRVTYAEHDLAL